MKEIQKVLLAGIVGLCLMRGHLYGAITFSNLISFNGANGANPVANLVEGSNGNFYGTTLGGGTSNSGTIFEVSPDGSFFTNVYNFSGGSNGADPAGALIIGDDGNFYGTTYNGGVSNWGTIFRLSPGGDFHQLGRLSGTNGANPYVALVQAADGSLYGTTVYGGPYPNTTSGGTGYGTIFRITTNGNLSVPVELAGTNGANATALVLGNDGNFYGTTAWGGNTLVPWGVGTIFRLSSDGTFTNLYKFTGFNDGGFPYGNLVQGGDGNFYGTAYNGGVNNFGTAYRITPAGQFTSLHAFTGGSDGGYPYAGLVQGSDGNLYGTTYLGGNGYGGVYEITPAGNVTPLVLFTGAAGLYPGAHPYSSLVQGSDGNFYGTTYDGGANGKGTVFRLSLPLPPVFKSVVKTNGIVTLVWSTVATQTYQLQYTTNLAQPSWTNIGGGVVATNGTMTASDSIGTDSQRFYRVVLSDLVSQ